MKTRTSIYHRTFAFAYVLLVAVIFCGCENETKKQEAVTENKNMKTVYNFGWYQHIRVYEVDSCEYIGFSGTSDGGTSIIHKQNCKFCAERSKK
jgi:hypothetical protein